MVQDGGTGSWQAQGVVIGLCLGVSMVYFRPLDVPPQADDFEDQVAANVSVSPSFHFLLRHSLFSRKRRGRASAVLPRLVLLFSFRFSVASFLTFPHMQFSGKPAKTAKVIFLQSGIFSFLFFSLMNRQHSVDLWGSGSWGGASMLPMSNLNLNSSRSKSNFFQTRQKNTKQYCLFTLCNQFG